MQALYPDTLPFGGPTEVLETSLDAVEHDLAALGTALRDRNADAVERHAGALHRSLAIASSALARPRGARAVCRSLCANGLPWPVGRSRPSVKAWLVPRQRWTGPSTS